MLQGKELPDDVLVVGGRTTGLMMCAELARRGIPTRCIDMSPGIDPHVRANLLHSRSLEIFQGLGLDDEITLGSVPETGFVFYRNGELVGESPHARIDSPFPFGLSQSQAHTEAVLEAHLNDLGIEVERSVSLTDLSQDEDGVTVTLMHNAGQEETSRYQWVIACDGAHSAVRHLVGTTFPGDADDIPYLLGDVSIAGDDDLAPDKGHVFFHDVGELYFFTRLPGNRHFIVASLERGADTNGTPPLEELQAIVSERAGPHLRLSDPKWLGYFRISYRLAPRFRHDRVFLAGDAAHVHSLLSGQGMNTGLQDAHNLAWKLTLVAQRKAPAEILDSYEAERRPVASEVVETTRQITNTMEAYTSQSKGEQNKFISQLITPDSERSAAARHLQEVDLDYGASSLSLNLEDTFQGGPKPGTRAPDADGLLFAGKSMNLFSLAADLQFRLFFFCGETGGSPLAEIKQAAESAGRFASFLTPYIVTRGTSSNTFGKTFLISDTHGNMHRIYAAGGTCIYLIRPDGYVAYRSEEIGSVDRYFKHIGLLQR